MGAVSKDENFHLVGLNGKEIVEANINNLKEAWQKPLRF